MTEDNKPFPYYPPEVPIEEMKRNALMQELNMWANNDEVIAKEKAAILVRLLTRQFNLGSEIYVSLNDLPTLIK